MPEPTSFARLIQQGARGAAFLACFVLASCGSSDTFEGDAGPDGSASDDGMGGAATTGGGGTSSTPTGNAGQTGGSGGSGGSGGVGEDDAGADIDDCPNDPNKIRPGVCGCGVADADRDDDFIPDCVDPCPGRQSNDEDGDAIPDCMEKCPDDPDKEVAGVCGCGVPDVDTDDDGTFDCFDDCPEDADKTEAGICGCGAADGDTDNDTTPDCRDGCPNDINKTSPGVCGCGASEVDTDLDGVRDCADGCPDDADKVGPGFCGCGSPDLDLDGDGLPPCIDNCPDQYNPDQADLDKDGEGSLCDCDDSESRSGANRDEVVCDNVDNDCDGTIDEGDPDGDSCEGCPCRWVPGTFAWEDITTTGTRISGLDGGDDASATRLIGFAFPYFGQTYSSLQVSTNGFLLLGSGTGAADNGNDPMPNTNTPNNHAASFWDDLVNDGGGIWYEQRPGQLIVSWETFSFWGSSTTNTTFQAIIDDQGGIQYQYLSGSGDAALASGSSATIGAEDATGTCAYPHSFDTASTITYPMNLTLECPSALVDLCPADANKTWAGYCGCGVADVDTDLDGALDCVDACPQDVDKVAPGYCGCGAADDVDPADGNPDCTPDACPADASKTEPGVCGCGVPDIDLDGDGHPFCVDCADQDAAVNTDATEDCDDGIDNDCDGVADLNDSDCF